MAEVFVATRTGPHGFVKRVALKRILPQFARDTDFVEMFVDEARLAGQLDHPNIVQVFDFGECTGELFLAMELVTGTTINRILRIASTRGEVIPLDVALYVVSTVARALHYAHGATDAAGRPLGVVHRDVSPANILLTRTGHIKLGDFGIARAAGMRHRTDEGRLRGKLGYMSPEQVTGQPLDGRSDVFTLAVVLAEMLIGEPLFGAGDDLDILLRIRDVDVRAIERSARRLPRDVRGMIDLGLSRDRAHRPSAATFADAIDEVIRRRGSVLHGPELLARLLGRYELAQSRPSLDHIAKQPFARPTRALPELEEATSETERLVRNLSVTSPAIYRVRMANGALVGPIGYPKLVEMIATGVVDRACRIAKDDGLWREPGAHPELARFVNSPALSWSGAVPDGAVTGEIRVSGLLGMAHRFAVDRETGVVHLRDEGRQKKVYFVDGRPEFVVSTTREEMLGEYLVNTGVIMRMELEMALAVLPRYSGRLGDALVGIGVLRPVELYHAVCAQVRARYLEALRWQRGQFAYVRGERCREEAYPFARDPFELLRDSVLECEDEELDAALLPHAPHVFSPSEHSTVERAGFRMPDAWLHALDAADGRSTLGELVDRARRRSAKAHDDARRAFYLGVSCGLLRLAA